MAIGTPNAGTATTFTSGTTSSVPFPATTTAGSTLTLGIMLQGANSPCTTPTGWTLAGSQGGTGFTLIPTLYVFYKVADGTEGGTNLSVTHGGPVTSEAQIVEWPGVDQVTPLDVTVVATDDSTAGSTTVLNTITPVTTACTVVYWAATNSNAGQTGAQPGGWTELCDGAGSTVTLESAYIANQSTSAVGGTITWSASGKQVAILAALRPAATGVVQNPGRLSPKWFQRIFRKSQNLIPDQQTPYHVQALPAQPARPRDMMRVGWIGRRRGHEYVVPPIAYHPQKLPPQPGRPRDLMRVGWAGHKRGHEFVVPPIAYHAQKLPPQPSRPRDMMRVGWIGRRRGREYAVPPLAYHTLKLPPQPQVVRHPRWFRRPTPRSAGIVSTPAVVTTQALPPQNLTRQPREFIRPQRRPTFVPPTVVQAPPRTSWRRAQPPRSRVRMYRRGVLAPVPALTLTPPTMRVRRVLPLRPRRARFVNPVPTALVTTGANAEAALVAVGAFDATISILVNAETTTVASTALDATASIAANAELISVLVAAYDVDTVAPLPGSMVLTDTTGTDAATDARVGSSYASDQRTGSGGASS